MLLKNKTLNFLSLVDNVEEIKELMNEESLNDIFREKSELLSNSAILTGSYNKPNNASFDLKTFQVC